MKKLFVFLIFIWWINPALGSTVIHGIIKDTETSQPLPYANIYIKNTYIGTISNPDGHYQLEIPRIPVEIIVSYIGYETRTILIEDNFSQELNILLTPVPIQLQEIVVSSDKEDPAIGIMKKVIANKIQWKKQLKSYQAKAYTRTRVENDTSIVSMSESVSKLYWDAEIGSREEFIAKKSSKRMSYLTELNVGAKNIYNFYEDNIQLINHKFVGPTHPDAFQYYDFELSGERHLNNQTVFDIQVKPKSRLQPLFSGRISILDEDFAMIEVDLKNSGSMNFFTMLKYFHGNYRQQFNNFGQEFWLPIDSRVEEVFKVDMGLIAFPKAILNKISRISNYEINVNVTHEIARLDTASTASQRAAKILANDRAFENFESVPLTAREQVAYSNPDTTMTLIKSFPPTGMMAAYFKSKEKDLEIALSEQGGYSPIPSNTAFSFQGWYNRVEGLNLGIKYKYRFREHYLLAAVGGYQTYSKRFYYETQLNYLLKKEDQKKYIFAGYSDKVETRYSSVPYSQLATSLLPLLGKADYFDYYFNQKFSAGLNYGLEDLRSEFLLAFNREENSSIVKKSDWNILNKSATQRLNPFIDDGRLNTIHFRFTYEEAYNDPEMEKTFGDKTDKIELQIEHSSSKYLKSDFDFTRFRLLADYRLTTFFQRRPDGNYLRARIEASTCRGTLPLQRFSVIDGSIFSYSPFGIFKTLANRPLEGEKTFSVFWEHNFKSIPFEMLGLRYFARNKYEFLIHGAAGRTWINKNRLQKQRKNYQPFYEDEFRNELGISFVLKFIFLSIRLDGTRNLNNDNDYLGFSLNLIGMSF